MTRGGPETGECLKRDRGFESGSLQRRVLCEPDSLDQDGENLPSGFKLARSFSYFVLDSSALQSFGQFGCPHSELFGNFRLDRSLLQISTSPCQLQKMTFVVH